MFINKSHYLKLQEENNNLKGKLEIELNNSKQKEEYLHNFLENFYRDLIDTIEQHEIVNGQHHVLGDLVGKIKERFDKVSSHSQLSFDKSKHLHEKGKGLIESTNDMVLQSNEGRDLVSNVEKLITKLGQQLEETSSKMNQLNDRSKEIEVIVKVIKEIADQTNLLALNASIEAARAGEHGKGFAVVAEEVRKLAENTSESTNNIGILINNIQKDIDNSLHSTQMSTGLIKEGIHISSETSNKIEYIQSLIKNVQLEVTDVLKTIGEQKVYSQEVMSEISNTKILFEEVNGMIIKHIEDASVVDEKLENGMNQVSNMTRNDSTSSMVAAAND